MPDTVPCVLPAARPSPDNETVLKELGLLSELAGSWEGDGFNLIARPDFGQKANLFLQLNNTRETLKIDPIGSPIPNRGFGQCDIALFGLTYLQKIRDAGKAGALHIEPGIWITQPTTSYPPEAAPAGQQLIARMGTIPHGNLMLAQGVAAHFAGDPVLPKGSAVYNGSAFPSFNSTPFPVPPNPPPPAPPAVPILNAAGSSEAGTVATPPGPPGFTQYDLAIPPVPAKTRTDPVPPGITQAIVNDPILILQNKINEQKKDGYKLMAGRSSTSRPRPRSHSSKSRTAKPALRRQQ